VFFIGLLESPTLWIIGDSTVRNGSGKGDNGQWGWGDRIGAHFDTTKIKIVNRAIGGRSSRTFLTEGRWDAILKEMKPGDFVLIQFGHNDPAALNDTSRARGTIKGIGEETEEIDNLLTKKHEIVHTFGWYIRKYVKDAKEKGATPIVCSYIPRCPRPDTKVELDPKPSSYRLWAQQVAEQEKSFYIDLFDLSWKELSKLPPDEIKKKFFCEADFTHTNEAGAILNASKVAGAIKLLPGCKLADFLKP
jgi:lysophospholipase L1-like esterase